MKKHFYLPQVLIAIVLLCGAGACRVGDMELQQNYHYHASVLDPNINMTTWDFMNSRNTAGEDSLFSIMLDAINYAGLKDLYRQDNGYTYFLLTDTSFTDPGQGYFHDHNIQSVEEMPVDSIKNLLLYHIVKGTYTSLDLTTTPQYVSTQYPADSVKMSLNHDGNFTVIINAFPGSKRQVSVVTSNLRPTNGVIHVLDRYAAYKL